MSNLEETLRPFVESRDVPGLVALVDTEGETEVVVLGEQDASGAPMRRDSIFRAASITKPLTAALALALVDDGLLDLDEEIDLLVPELTGQRVLRTPGSPLDDTVPRERPVTLRHLLEHSCGLGFVPVDNEVVPLLVDRLGQGSVEEGDVPPPDEWVARLAGIPLLHQPGAGWTYNFAYDLLGVVLARAAGQDLPALMAHRLLRPLGMTDTGFVVPPADLDRLTTFWGRDGQGRLEVLDPVDGLFASPQPFASGAGGLVTTADDWAAFGRMVLTGGGDVLSAGSVRLMTTDQTTPAQREMGGGFLDGQGWGLGGGVDTDPQEPWQSVGRWGWVGGTGTAAHVDPSRDQVTVILTRVSLGGPEAAGVFEAFWRAAAG